MRRISSTLLAALTAVIATAQVFAQDSIEWYTLGNDYAHTRYTPSAEITAENFEEMEVVWEWDGATFEGYSGRSTPSYINGTLYTSLSISY